MAAATAAHLVSADGPLTDRANVLNGSRLDEFDAEALEATAPATDDYAVNVRLGGREVAATGDARGGTTMRRLVLVERTESRSIDPESRQLTLPRRATSATVTFTSSGGAPVRTMRVNGQVRLHDDSGLRGTFTVPVTPYRTTRIGFQTAGDLSDDSVGLTYETPRTTKATLAVTVDG